jgi:hypothetical protein
MRAYSDINLHDDQDSDGLMDQPGGWLESVHDELPDGPEADLGERGVLRPWKTTDI